MPSPRRKQSLDVMAASHLGLSLAISMVLFTYGGSKLDEWLGTSPLLLIVGAFLGLGTGMTLAVRTIDRLGRRMDGDPDTQDSPDDES